MASFMVPVDDELAKLAYGVPTYDAIDRNIFDLHAYAILEHGDINAIEKMLGIKGHNGISPCRSCKIRGVRDITGCGKVYYVPLTTPDVDHQTRPSVDPRSLSLRKHEDFASVLQQMAAATTKKAREDIAKANGIRNAPALCRVGSLNHAKSNPWEWLHLFCENIIPNLFKLWTGQYKQLDTGTEAYEIPEHIWEQIGEETASAVKNIPSSFVRVLGNIAQDRSTYIAESWGFWFMYLAPILLKGRFTHNKYYRHMIALVKIMKTTLKFELTMAEIDAMEEEVICWVELYEE